jgi:hypothetical protein
MKRRFYFTLLVLALILIALPSFVAKGIRQVTRTVAQRPANA